MNSDKPNCYNCKHRREAGPGTVHSSCHHPESGMDRGGAFAELVTMFGSRMGPAPTTDGATKLNINASAHGRRKGWFNWPFNFDPVWLQRCDGFEAAEEVAGGL